MAPMAASPVANQAYAHREFRCWYDDDGGLCFAGRVPADSAPLILDMLAAGRAALKTPILDDTEDAEDVPAGTSGAGGRPDQNVPAGASGAGGRPDQNVPAGTSGAAESGDQNVPAGASGAGGRPGENVPAGASGASELRDDGVPAGTSGVDAAESLGARTVDALLIAETFLATATRQRSGGERTTIKVIIDLETLTLGTDGDCHLANGRHLAAANLRRLGCDGNVISHLMKDGCPLDVGRAQRPLNRAQRRAVQRRDRGCRWPGCTRRGFFEMHHLVHWIDDGLTNLDNLTNRKADPFEPGGQPRVVVPSVGTVGR